MNDLPLCADCNTPILAGQGFNRLNGRDDAAGVIHAYAEDCRKALLARVAELESQNTTLLHILEQERKE